MSYSSIYMLSQDTDFRARVQVCLHSEGVATPEVWLINHALDVAREPGLADAYESAIVRHIDRPGLYEEVISDGTILAAVQAVMKNTPPV